MNRPSLAVAPREFVGSEPSDQTQRLLECGYVLLLMYLSGSIFFISFHYQAAVFLVTGISAIALMWHLSRKPTLAKGSVLQLLAFGSLLTLTILANPGTNIGAHMAVFLQMFIAAVAAALIPIERFAFHTSKLMGYLAAISLVFFLIGFIAPSLVQLLPMTPGIASVDYYNAGLHVYSAPIGYGEFVLATRNNGIFWEPGAYQAFLNLGLFWLLDDSFTTPITKKTRTFLAVAIIIAVLSTFSAMGYVLLGFILVARRDTVRQVVPFGWRFGLLAIAVIVWIAFRPVIPGDLAPLKYIDNPSTILERLSVDRLLANESDWREFFFGASLVSETADYGSIWNSIVHVMVTLGIPFTILLLSNYLRGARAMSRHWLTLSIILILSFSTESLIWRPFFLYVAFATSPSKSHMEPSLGRNVNYSIQRSRTLLS